MNRIAAWLSVGLSGLFAVPGSHAQPQRLAPLPAPTYAISLGGRDACVTPHTRNRARADGGKIDVQITSPSAGFFTVTMTGTPAAESYLCCTSTAAQTFHLVQEFEVSCSDPRVRFVALTLDSSLVGYVRSARKAGASVRLATASVIAESSETSPLSLSHPTLASSGTEGHLCNQHLPPLEGRLMPIGRYTLVADFVLETTASGISTAHAVADFSPDTALPADWVRTRDPFQGVSKNAFGFTLSISCGAPSGAPPRSGVSRGERRTDVSSPTDRGLMISMALVTSRLRLRTRSVAICVVAVTASRLPR